MGTGRDQTIERRMRWVLVAIKPHREGGSGYWSLSNHTEKEGVGTGRYQTTERRRGGYWS